MANRDSQTELLDELSGFEFEDFIEDVFRKLGYENVQKSVKTADEGRDITMEEPVPENTTNRAVIVECKHTDTVGRPVVQKLHSAVTTYPHSGPARGMVVTTGRFTDPAIEYATELGNDTESPDIDLMDGDAIRSLSDEVGFDIYNGRIEILCDEMLPPAAPGRSVTASVYAAVDDITYLTPTDLSDPTTTVDLQPMIYTHGRINATFETSVGVINRIKTTTDAVTYAGRRDAEQPTDGAVSLITNGQTATRQIDESQLEQTFDTVITDRFQTTETEHKQDIIADLQRKHTETVSYTGDNNVSYTKQCTPDESDIHIDTLQPIYIPHVAHTITLGKYEYPYRYYAAGSDHEITTDALHRCVHCDTGEQVNTLLYQISDIADTVDVAIGRLEGEFDTFTYCLNCGSINCTRHIRTDRLTGEPVCTGCATTDRFALRKRYFQTEANRDTFGTEFASNPLYWQAAENTTAIIAVIALLLIALIIIL